jgi:hypothetical protein
LLEELDYLQASCSRMSGARCCCVPCVFAGHVGCCGWLLCKVALPMTYVHCSCCWGSYKSFERIPVLQAGRTRCVEYAGGLSVRQPFRCPAPPQ